MSIIASVIIPTHNRSASLKKMLESLKLQSFALQNFEVIVVADGCRDDTVDTVKNYQAKFHLSFYELPGVGAATARNKGASFASGKYLIFVDDDMELSSDFIEEHIASHKSENDVVIGYSPFKLESKASMQRMSLREWWEEKFQAMRDKRYRFKYDDLTSGNFSISSNLFKKLNGFDTTLLCREDYEQGFRLIKAGAEFRFAYEAKAFHQDEVTDLKRSLQRKKSEGMADIQIKTMHPDFINKEALFYLSQRSFSKAILLRMIEYIPSLTDVLANFGSSLMNYFEKIKMWSKWQSLNYRLHQYWYLRGAMIRAKSSKKLYRFITNQEFILNNNQKLIIDLLDGLKKNEEEIDNAKPLAIDIYYGKKFIGTVNYEAGAEALKGIHLRKLLKDNFSKELSSVLVPETFL
jgi:glycosyltransferase involved in cell wall biosynthesis